ncbi:MAG: hypothetical protein CW342_00340 [Thermoactinomycetaceae bacterium]|nr:hypothetical protein [Bacillota bacterium]MBO2531338.1 hypothetical protein [Thermoactinomycetaceae bacterium]
MPIGGLPLSSAFPSGPNEGRYVPPGGRGARRPLRLAFSGLILSLFDVPGGGRVSASKSGKMTCKGKDVPNIRHIFLFFGMKRPACAVFWQLACFLQ